MESRVEAGDVHEDQFTGAIEKQTSKIPSSLFLGMALASMATSAIMKLSGRDGWALFIGQWAAPFLLLGTYNKLVKQHGSDAHTGPVELAA